MIRLRIGILRMALPLAGSAVLLFSCEGKPAADNSAQDEAMMTMYSEDLDVVESKNGRKSYHFSTPLMEEYGLAREPYREFRKGVRIVTFNDDSVSSVDATLTSNYAIYYTNRELWEARGNVVAETAGGRTLYTQQLFWNAKTKRIYSNVDSKIVQSDGVFYGEGLESDDALRDWRFRRMTGRMEVEMKPADDTVAGERPRADADGPAAAVPAAAVAGPAAPVAPAAPAVGSASGSGPKASSAQRTVPPPVETSSSAGTVSSARAAGPAPAGTVPPPAEMSPSAGTVSSARAAGSSPAGAVPPPAEISPSAGTVSSARAAGSSPAGGGSSAAAPDETSGGRTDSGPNHPDDNLPES